MTDAVRAAFNLAIKLETEGRGADAKVIAAALHHLATEHGKTGLMLHQVLETMVALEQDLGGLPPGSIPEGILGRMKATLTDWRQSKDKRKATNIRNASKPRGSRFPAWMHDEAVAYAAGKVKPSAILALDRIQSAASALDYAGELPDESTVRNWMSQERN